MTHETPHRPANDKHAGPEGPPNNKWKWLAGGAAALALAGGGYYAMKNYSPSQAGANSEIAYQDQDGSYRGEPLRAAPLNEDESDSVAEPASSASAPRRTQSARSEPSTQSAVYQPAEETIGVTPTNISYETASYPTEGGEIVVPGQRRPLWSRAPSANRLSEIYPESALTRQREGEANVSCTVLENGALDCVRVSEYPANAGFGMAALRVARMFRHAPERLDGSPAVGTAVNMHVLFRLEDDRRARG